jgi:hypothetical protein
MAHFDFRGFLSSRYRDCQEPPTAVRIAKTLQFRCGDETDVNAWVDALAAFGMTDEEFELAMTLWREFIKGKVDAHHAPALQKSEDEIERCRQRRRVGRPVGLANLFGKSEAR